MIHHRIFRHVVLGLCSFCFSAAAFADCLAKSDPLKCMGSTKTVDVTFTATLQTPSCNVSLGGESNLGGKSLVIDFVQIIARDLDLNDERYNRPLGIFLTGCDNMLNKAKVTFSINSADLCSDPHKTCLGMGTMLGLKIKDRVKGDFITFNSERDMTLNSNGEGYFTIYDIYIMAAFGGATMSSGYFEESFQIIVRYN